jgi:hypothetical protein
VSLRRDIRECQRYADACARIAARTADAKTRDDFLGLQHCWLRLERCLAFAARLPGVRIFSNAADGEHICHEAETKEAQKNLESFCAWR